MEEIEKLTMQLEYMFLKKIISGFRDESIPTEQAKQYATDLLALEPFASVDDAKKKMNEFVEKYSIFNQMKDYMNAYHEEQKTDAVIAKMRGYLKSNDVDQALKVAKST